ncbi:hypothetical protein [Enterococcus diestrammenae]|uniref:Uncharacterized protein n=1 Tax=Enterococcus diestrammenae TaxID=1155073 RepID=A0ABV0F842_9ENTE|nr:hypothetical protein [Enterococcus diestrammenae]KAF1300041.1 hypothetical protein BAU18_13060 [Enterococcus diestrammenae]
MNKQEVIEKLREHGAWCTECHDINGKKDRYVKAAKVRELLEQLDEPQAEKVEAHLAEHWHEDTGDVLWWNFPVEEPPYCGTPLDEHFPKYKTHFSMIDMPNEIEKPKRWVVKFKDAETDFYFIGWSDIYKTDDNPFVPNGYVEKDKDRVFMFDDRAKAEAVAVLVEGSVEEI